MKESRVRALLLIGIAAFQLSCGNKFPHGCEKHIREKIKVGDSLEAAETDLKNCGFQTTMDPKETLDPSATTLYGDKRVTVGIITERTQVLVKVDSTNKVKTVQVTEGLIGP